MTLNKMQIFVLGRWLVEQQQELGSGFGEGCLLMGAAVIWEHGQ